jgi:hypothetical protein
MEISRLAWEDLGNKLHTGRVTLNEFRGYLRGSASLHDIQVLKVLIVDHLGKRIPVPVMFCSSWKVHIFHSRTCSALLIR